MSFGGEEQSQKSLKNKMRPSKYEEPGRITQDFENFDAFVSPPIEKNEFGAIRAEEEV